MTRIPHELALSGLTEMGGRGFLNAVAWEGLHQTLGTYCTVHGQQSSKKEKEKEKFPLDIYKFYADTH